MASAEKQLLIRLVARADGQPVIAGFGRSVAELASSEGRLERQLRSTNLEARRQSSVFSDLTGSTRRWISTLAGAAGLGLIAKETFDYNQELEGTQIAIAGLLYANSRYTDSLGNVVDRETAWQAANAESISLLAELQRESLKTAATVPQIADAFAIVYGALNQAGITAERSAIVQLTTRLTQAASAMKVPMEQIRQEITSLLTGQVTQDSTIAKRLGLDNASIETMKRSGTLIDEIMRRAEGYAKAAEAQATTVRGKLVNTVEIVTATLSRAFDPVFDKSKQLLDGIFRFFETRGDSLVAFAHRVVGAVERIGSAIGKWVTEHQSLVTEILSVGSVAAVAVGAYGLIAAAIAAVTSPIGLTIAGVVALAVLWEKTRHYSEIDVGGRPIAAYVRATWEAVTSIWTSHIRVQLGLIKALAEGVVAGATTWSAAMTLLGTLAALPMRALRALGEVAGEVLGGARQLFARLVEFAAPVTTRIVAFVHGIAAAFHTLVGAAETPARRVVEVFDGLVTKLAAPLRRLIGFVAELPDKLIALVPGAEAVRDAARDLLSTLPGLVKPVETLGTTLARVGRDAKASGAEIRAALDTKGGLGSITDAVRQGWESAAKWLEEQLPELKGLGEKATSALGLTSTSTVTPPVDPNAAGKAQRAAARLEREKDEYIRFINEYRNEAAAAGDPLGVALAKIRSDRQDAISKLEAQRKELKDAISPKVFDADRDAINTVFDSRAAEARRKSIEGIKNDLVASLRLQHELTVNTTRETEDRRIALITDATRRTLAEHLAANARWLEDESDRVAQSIDNETERARQIELLAEERKRRDARDREDADRAMREATFGYAEYWKGLSDTIAAQWRGIGQTIADTILQSRSLLADTVNNFLGDLTSGQTDILKSLTGLSKGLVSVWTKALTDILMKGESVSKKIQDLFRSIHVKKEDGSTDYVGTALAGAGFGGSVGGLFQTESNYAGLGGTVGGAIGAIVGVFAGNPAIGAAIGTAIGTALGSLIQKGKDSIRVAIRDGVATVTESGISAEARAEVQTQVQRKVKEEVKGWQKILDLFPQSVREHLENLYSSGKLARPSLNLEGGVESADLTDESALNSLTDFLSNDLPRAAFNAYSGAIRAALGQLGAGSQRISELFAYWGTLQGKELQDAVGRYVRVVLDTADLREKLDAPIDEKLAAARRYGGQVRPTERLDEISAAIDAAVTRMAGLKDIEDIVAAQEEVNSLSRQYYELQLQYLARIQQIQESITTSIAQQREQIQLAGMDDQQKANHFFERMLALRGQLEAATDPEDINRLTQQIQSYVSQALGLAPDNADMRARLMSILGDIEVIASTRLAQAMQDEANRDDKPASALERASELLLKAAGDLAAVTDPDGDGVNRPEPGTGKPDEPGVDRPTRPHPDPVANSESVVVMTQISDRIDRLIALREAEISHSRTRAEEWMDAIRNSQSESRQGMRPEDVAAAIREALRAVEFRIEEPIVIDNGDLGSSVADIAERRVIARLRDDPYSVIPRAA